MKLDQNAMGAGSVSLLKKGERKWGTVLFPKGLKTREEEGDTLPGGY